MKVLVVFVSKHHDFHIPEIKSVIETYDLDTTLYMDTYQENNIFLTIEVNEMNDIYVLASRCVLIRYFVKVIATGASFEELNMNISPDTHFDYFEINPETSFKIEIFTFQYKFSNLERSDMIEKLLSHFKYELKICMVNPHTTLILLYNHYYKGTRSPLTYCFGELIGEGQTKLHSKFSLNNRPFIGSTSLDPNLSFLMANQAQIKLGDFVYDPFVGTGSILVAASYFGAKTIGSDISFNLLHGKTKPSVKTKDRRDEDEGIEKNFDFYNLSHRYLGCSSIDITKLHFHSYEIFDAIITDPPYGIREASKNTNIKNGITLSYTLENLMIFALKYLKVNGHLVYWLPISSDETSDSIIPTHPCLALKHKSMQKLQTRVSRLLVTMKKIESVPINNIGTFIFDNQLKKAHDNFRNIYFNIK